MGRADATVAAEEHCLYCFDVLAAHYAGSDPPPPTFDIVECPLFVTWNKAARRQGDRHQLRGCIGCLRPLPLTSLRDYTLNAALHDRRFAPIAHREIPELVCTVQLLGQFERVSLLTDWTIGVHGVSINFVEERGIARSAVYLPDGPRLLALLPPPPSASPRAPPRLTRLLRTSLRRSDA